MVEQNGEMCGSPLDRRIEDSIADRIKCWHYFFLFQTFFLATTIPNSFADVITSHPPVARPEPLLHILSRSLVHSQLSSFQFLKSLTSMNSALARMLSKA